MAILESRMSTVDSQNMLESEIRSLRTQQKEMEAIIRRQDETICRLNEDNQLFKTQLTSLTKTLLNEIPNNSKNKNPSSDNVINIMDDSLPFANELPTNSKKNQSSSTIIEILLSSDKDQHTNLNTNATADVDQLKSLLLAQTKGALSSKQKEIINMQRNRIPNSRLQAQQPSNISTKNNAEQNPKSSIPFPYLLRRSWCIKKHNCDFKHPQRPHPNESSDNVPKHRVRCPFLHRRGFCLKGDRCDFSHSNTPNISSTQSLT